MSLLLFAIIGAIVGLTIDVLAVRLASAPLPQERARPASFARAWLRAGQAELGSLRQLGTPALNGRRISAPLVRRSIFVAVGAGGFVLAAARYDEPGHLAIVGAYLAVLFLCACTDILAYRVPNVVTYPAIVGALVVGAFLPEVDFRSALVAGAIAGGLLLVPSLVTNGIGMGMGDVKLAAFAGLAVGLNHVVPMLLLMALAGGAVAGLLLLTGTRGPRDRIAYAPFISGATVVVLLSHGTAFATLGPALG